MFGTVTAEFDKRKTIVIKVTALRIRYSQRILGENSNLSETLSAFYFKTVPLHVLQNLSPHSY